MQKRAMRIGVCAMAAMAGFAALAAGGPSPQVRAFVSQSHVTLADTVQYSVEIKGISPDAIAQSEFPDFQRQGFQCVSGPSTEHSIVMTGFQATSTLTYRWQLQPMREGTLTIGPLRLRLRDGRTLVSNTVAVMVSRTETAGAALPGFAGEQIYWARTDNEAINRRLRGKLFLRPVIDKTEAYVGEQITLTYELYQAEGLRVTNYNIASRADFTGFLVETIYPARRLQFRTQTVGNAVYNVATIETVALFATKSGPTTISSFVMTADIPVRRQRPRRRSIFDDPFFNDPFFDFGFPSLLDTEMVRARLVARPIGLNILALPTEGRPSDFSGTVGSYTMSASFDRSEVRQNDLVTLKVEFSGHGLVDAISPPRLPEVSGLALFKKHSSSEVEHAGSLVGGKKTFEFFLRPTKPGLIRLPPIEYVVFDPAEKQYERLRTEPLALRVLAAPDAAKPVVADFTGTRGGEPGAAGSPVQEINRDIEYIRTTGFLRHGLGAVPLYQRPGFLLFQLFPICLVVVSYAVRRRRDRLEGDVAFARRRAARTVATKRLRGARKLLSPSNSERFFEELDRALRRFVADQLNVSAAGLTVDAVRQSLERRAVDQRLVEEMVGLLELCESARYSARTATEAEMRQVYDRAASLIDQLARAMK